MLVWYYIPGGISDIPELNLRVYGYSFVHPPAEVSYAVYNKYRKTLVLAPYTGEWLSRKYNADFGDISFTYNEIKRLPYDVLFDIAKKMGLWDKPGRPKHKALAMLIRRSLREK